MIAIITAAFDTTHIQETYESLCLQDIPWRWLIQLDGDAELPSSISSDPRVSAESNGRQMGAAISRVNALVRLNGEKFVANLDADDKLLPGALAVMQQALESEPQAAFAFGLDVTVHEDGSQYPYGGPLKPGLIPKGKVIEEWRVKHHPPMHPAGIMWRSDALIAYGAWSALWSGQDTAVVMASSVHHPCVFVDHKTLWYRWHEAGQLSRSLHAKQLAQTKIDFIKMRVGILEKAGPSWNYKAKAD